ncbi:histidine kinase [Sinomicrobium soli]|nr:histidine kinase [Sinomicrobium sp. N-1-3-6]
MASMLAGSMAPRPVSAVFITERGKGEDTMSRKDSRGYRFRMPFTIGPAKEGPVPPPFMPGDTTNLKQLEYHFPNHPVPPDSWRFRFLMLLRPAGLMGIYFIIGAAVRIYMEWRKGEAVRQQIQSEKMTSELQFLKAQLNPHFLFNSLNSVYSLSVKKSNDTPEAILTLSELMRYMLYEANRDFVPLGKELDYIKNYIKLQRLRLSDGEKVTLNIYGNERDKKIQPLLFISFIENAFKYGTDYTGKTVVKTVISIRDDSIHFFISNIVGSYKKDTESSGVGLQNIRNRLDLLYPDMNKLDVTDDGKIFTVSLTLNFGSK